MDNKTVDGGHLSYANYREYINLNLLLPMAGELIWKQKECDIHDTKDTHASAWGRYGYLLKSTTLWQLIFPCCESNIFVVRLVFQTFL